MLRYSIGFFLADLAFEGMFIPDGTIHGFDMPHRHRPPEVEKLPRRYLVATWNNRYWEMPLPQPERVISWRNTR